MSGNAGELLAQERAQLGPMTRGERIVATTPPNALVFGSGYLTIPQMARSGALLDLIAIALVTLASAFLIPLVFGA